MLWNLTIENITREEADTIVEVLHEDEEDGRIFENGGSVRSMPVEKEVTKG